MLLSTWFDGSNVEIAIPENCDIQVFDLPATRLTKIAADHWLNRGTVPANLAQFLADSERLLVVVNDIYRPTPTARILATLRDQIRLEKTRFLVATGLHPGADKSDEQAIFGGLSGVSGARVSSHQAFREDELADFGQGALQCRLNKLFKWCDAILTIGSVEPHYFAGFTGGRKIILPGCASFADVERNHAQAVSESSQPLRRTGNPVWDDLRLRTQVLDELPRASVQVVCDHRQNIFFASQGDWDDSYDQACDFVKDHYAHAVSEPFDVVISVVYPPLDRNLYQLQKSYENVAAAVRDGGTILLVSGCRDGVGDRRFLKLAEQIARGEKPEAGEGEGGLMGIHKVERTIRLAKRVDLVLCSRLEPSVLRSLPIAARPEIQSAVNELIEKYGNQCRVAVVLDAAAQVLLRAAA